MSTQGQSVRFKLSDIFIPHPLIVLYALHGDDLVRGRVVDLTYSGVHHQTFAVVEVAGIERFVVVPIDRIVAGE